MPGILMRTDEDRATIVMIERQIREAIDEALADDRRKRDRI